MLFIIFVRIVVLRWSAVNKEIKRFYNVVIMDGHSNWMDMYIGHLTLKQMSLENIAV
ncbi:hypothetical protein D1872_194160 [compost metagenome]